MKNWSRLKAALWAGPGLILLLTVGSRGLGFVREQVVAALLGASRSSDALAVAIVLSNLVSGIVADTTGNALIPIYLRVREERGPLMARQVGGKVLAGVALMLFTLCLIIGFAAPSVVQSVVTGFEPRALDMAGLTTRIVMIGTFFFGCESITRALLNAERLWWASNMAPMIQNGVAMLGFLLLFRYEEAGLAIAISIGMVAMLTWELFILHRRRLFKFQTSASGVDTDIRQITYGAVSLALGAGIGQVGILFDQYFASGLPAGSITALSYADKIRQLPVAVAFALVSSLFYPAISRYVAERDAKAVTRHIRRTATLLLAPSVLVAITLFVLSVPVTGLLFERGVFDNRATALTASALQRLAPGIVAMIMAYLFTFTLWSIGGMKISVAIECLVFLLRLTLNSQLVPRYGLTALAAVDTCIQFSRCLLLGAACITLLKRYFRAQISELG